MNIDQTYLSKLNTNMKQQKRSQVVKPLTGANTLVASRQFSFDLWTSFNRPLPPAHQEVSVAPKSGAKQGAITEDLLHFNSNILLENPTAMANRGQLG